MKAKLVSPHFDKSWSLQIFEIPNDKQLQNEIWYHARIIAQHFGLNPFQQGNSDGWMMVEYWNDAQGYILEAAMKTCEVLNIPLEID